MALNKAQTTLGVKIVLIVVAVAMVGFLFPAVFSLFQGNDAQNANTNATQGTLDQIAAKYNAQVASNDQALKTDPTNYQTLAAQGNTYFDWALDVMQAAQKDQKLVGTDQPMWLSARQFYERALEATQSDPPLQTDLSIVYFYSGDATAAVALATKVTETAPTFAPAWLNLGVFHSALGNTPVAIAAYAKAIELDPTGKTTNIEYAKQQLTALKSGSTGTTTTSP